MEIEVEKEVPADRRTDTQADRYTDRQIHRQTDRKEKTCEKEEIAEN